MGAYENPITVIDTESAKMWQQATANIAQISINAMNAVSARKTKEAKEQEAEATDRTAMAMENQEAVIDRITKSGIKSDAYFQYGMALMDDVTKLEGDLKYYTGDKDQKSLMMKDLAIKKKSISQLVTQGGEVQDYIQEYRERRGIGESDDAAPDTPGGMLMVGDEATVRYHKIMGALSGMDKGALQSVYMKDGFLFGKIEGIEGDVNLTNESRYDPGDVIDSTKLIKEALDSAKIYNGTEYNKRYYDYNNIKIKETKQGNKIINQTVIPYLTEQITNDSIMAINNKGMAVLKSEDANSIRGWYMLNAGENAGSLNFVNEIGGTKKVLDEESTKKWLEVFIREGKKQIANHVVVTEDNIDQFDQAKIGDFRAQIEGKRDINVSTTKPPTEKEDNQYVKAAKSEYRNFLNSPTSLLDLAFGEGNYTKKDKESNIYLGPPDEKNNSEKFDIDKPRDIRRLYEIYDGTDSGRKTAREMEKFAQVDEQKRIEKLNKEKDEKAKKEQEEEAKQSFQKNKSFMLNRYVDSDFPGLPENASDEVKVFYKILEENKIGEKALRELTDVQYSKLASDYFKKFKTA
jgi:hypothetical protein